MSEKMPCSITDGPQYDAGFVELCDICGENEPGNSGYCYDCQQERAIEAGDHLLDSRKEDSLSNALLDITRRLQS